MEARTSSSPQPHRTPRAIRWAGFALFVIGLWLFLFGYAQTGVICAYVALFGTPLARRWAARSDRLAAFDMRAALDHAAAVLAAGMRRATGHGRTRHARRGRIVSLERKRTERAHGDGKAAFPSTRDRAPSPAPDSLHRTTPAPTATAGAAAREQLAVRAEVGSCDAEVERLLRRYEVEQLARKAYRRQSAIVSLLLLCALLGQIAAPFAMTALGLAVFATLTSVLYRHGAIVFAGLGPRRFAWRHYLLIPFGFFWAAGGGAQPYHAIENAIGALVFAAPIALAVFAAMHRLRPRTLPRRAPGWPVAVAIAFVALAWAAST